MVHWRAGIWESIWRCVDRQACKQRVKSAGQAWPILDAVDPLLSVAE
jgi:hypothetical protein